MASELYCPRCATACQSDASFCRACGLQLGEIGAIVRGDSPKSQPDRYRPNFNFMRMGLCLFIFGLVIGLANGALRSFNLYPDEWGKAIFLGFVTIGMACLGLGLIVPARRKRGPATKQDVTEIKPATTTSQLPAGDLETADAVFSAPTRERVMAQPGSVTESTTRNLQKD